MDSALAGGIGVRPRARPGLAVREVAARFAEEDEKTDAGVSREAGVGGTASGSGEGVNDALDSFAKRKCGPSAAGLGAAADASVGDGAGTAMRARVPWLASYNTSTWRMSQ
jgi:hypothetical protein